MRFIQLGSLFAFLAVMAGAFGAHALRGHVTDARLAVFQTGVLYQMMHALALILFGVVAHWSRQNGLVTAPAASWPGWAFVVGIVLFSGSLYTLVLTDVPALGMITPFGGVSFLVGWVGFFGLAWRLGRAVPANPHAGATG